MVRDISLPPERVRTPAPRPSARCLSSIVSRIHSAYTEQLVAAVGHTVERSARAERAEPQGRVSFAAFEAVSVLP